MCDCTPDKQEKSPLDAIFLTIPQAAERMAVGALTIRRMIDDGRIPAYRFGRSIRIRPHDLDNCAKRITAVADIAGGDDA